MIKKSFWFFSLIAMGLGYVNQLSADRNAKDRVFLAPEYLYRNWNFSPGPNDPQNMWGIVAGYEHLGPNTIFARFKASLFAGPAKDPNGNWYDHEFEVEGECGYTFAFGCHKQWKVSPYTGLNYYQVFESIDPGLYREYMGSVPIGLLIGWDLNSCFTIQVRAQANIQFLRKLYQLGSSATLSKKTRWLAEVPLTYRLNCHLDLSFVPFYSFDPNANFRFSGDNSHQWGSINTYGGRLEIGYSL